MDEETFWCPGSSVTGTRTSNRVALNELPNDLRCRLEVLRENLWLCLVGGRVGSCAQEGQCWKASLCEMLVPMRTLRFKSVTLGERRGLADSDRKRWLEIQATGAGKEQAGRMESSAAAKGVFLRHGEHGSSDVRFVLTGSTGSLHWSSSSPSAAVSHVSLRNHQSRRHHVSGCLPRNHQNPSAVLCATTSRTSSLPAKHRQPLPVARRISKQRHVLADVEKTCWNVLQQVVCAAHAETGANPGAFCSVRRSR